MIHCSARFHPLPRRLTACRTASWDSRRGVNSCSKATSANRSSVQVLRALPKWRGDWWRMPLSGSAFAWSRIGCAFLGPRFFSSRQPAPSFAKAWIVLWTVPTAQPTCAAIRAGRWPSALARRIWARRSVNASRLRSPAWSARRSASDNSRTNNGAFITHYSGPTTDYQVTE